MDTVAYPHLERASDGTLFISGTAFKFIQIVLDRIAYGWEAEEIQRQHPSLTLGQIHSALAYYYDHQEEVDSLIQDRLRREEELVGKLNAADLLSKLRVAKRRSP